jgi:hypothetical protein
VAGNREYHDGDLLIGRGARRHRSNTVTNGLSGLSMPMVGRSPLQLPFGSFRRVVEIMAVTWNRSTIARPGIR